MTTPTGMETRLRTWTGPGVVTRSTSLQKLQSTINRSSIATKLTKMQRQGRELINFMGCISREDATTAERLGAADTIEAYMRTESKTVCTVRLAKSDQESMFNFCMNRRHWEAPTGLVSCTSANYPNPAPVPNGHYHPPTTFDGPWYTYSIWNIGKHAVTQS